MSAISNEELHDAWEKVKAMTSIPEPPEPKMPVFSAKTTTKTRLHAFQNLINSLEYNYTGTLYFDVNKNRSFKSIVNTAKDILKEGLPIQCLEAVFLAAYLTAEMSDLERFPVSFKSMTGSSTHRHIILAVRHQSHKWGALGLSRCDKLMNKELKFASLSELILDYCHEFQNIYHKVVKVYVGFPFSHDIHSSEKVDWRVLNLPVDLEPSAWTEASKQFDRFAKEAPEILIFKKAKGELPEWFNTKFALNAPEVESGRRSPRATQRGLDPLDFDDEYDELEESQQECASAPVEPPPKVPGPILISPEEFVFKKPSTSDFPAPPTNVFLQNKTSSPFSIEIEDVSGQLEIVTIAQPGLSPPKTQQMEDRDENSSEKSATMATFRLSAKGMIVVAMKYNPPGGCTPREVPPTETKVVPCASPAKSPRSKMAKKSPLGKSSPRIVPITEPVPAPVVEPAAAELRQVVTFRCTPMTRVSEDTMEEVPDGDTYTEEMPFVYKEM